MRHHYLVYGWHVSTNLPVPGLLPGLLPGETSERTPDVRVELGPFPAEAREILSGEETPWPHRLASPDADLLDPLISTFREERCFRFRFSWGVEFVFDVEDKRIWCEWDAPLTIDHAALYLTGPILGFLLRRSGVTGLHASAVVLLGGAVAFLGASGVGKSTTAMALGARGYPILSDDVLVLRSAPDGVLAFPAHGRLRLWPDALDHLLGPASSRPRLVPDWEKGYAQLGDALPLQDTPLLLRTIYVLSPDLRAGQAKPEVTPVHPAEALPLLAANSYRAELLSPAMRATEFDFLASTAEAVPVRRLHLRLGLSGLSNLCDLIEADAATLASEPGVGR